MTTPAATTPGPTQEQVEIALTLLFQNFGNSGVLRAMLGLPTSDTPQEIVVNTIATALGSSVNASIVSILSYEKAQLTANAAATQARLTTLDADIAAVTVTPA